MGMFDRTCFVYVFRNTFNGRTYVGETCKPKEREREHRNALKRGNHQNAELQADYDKFGDVFEFEIIETCPSERDGRTAEIKWMCRLQSFDDRFGYNIKDWKMQPMRKAAGLESMQSNAKGKSWNWRTHYRRRRNRAKEVVNSDV